MFRPVYRCGPPAGPTDLLRHQVFEAGPGDVVVGLIDQRIRIQPRVVHDPVDKIVDDGGDWINASQTLVERRLWRGQFGISTIEFSHGSR
jgi:hypothetical protein